MGWVWFSRFGCPQIIYAAAAFNFTFFGSFIVLPNSFANGEKCSETSIDQRGNGIVIIYRKNGSKWRTDRYINGQISERNYHGMFTKWDEQGQKKSKVN